MTEGHICFRRNSWEEMYDTSTTIEKGFGASPRRYLGCLFNTIRIEFEVTREDPGLQSAGIGEIGGSTQGDIPELLGGVESHCIRQGDGVEA